MQTTTTQPAPVPIARSTVRSHPWLMLFSRSVLFMLFQGILALILMWTGTRLAWNEAARYWMLIVSVANIVSVYLLIRVFRIEK